VHRDLENVAIAANLTHYFIGPPEADTKTFTELALIVPQTT
jgi:hypothetical protein